MALNQYRLLRYESADELRENAAAWDDLWLRSHATRPVARAATLAQWIEHFAPQSRFCALMVVEGQRLLAGLPLIGQRIGGVMEAGFLPHNAWSPAGDLLLDRRSEAIPVLTRLVAGLRDLPWSLLWLDKVPLESPPWQAFREVAASAGIGQSHVGQLDVGMIDLAKDWDTYRDSWSDNHRRNLRKAIARLGRQGRLETKLYTSVANDEVETLLRRAFEIERRGWKGRAGTSILQSPGMFEFYCEQARLLAARGELMVALLNYDDQPVAFEYGFAAKGTYHALKVGFDPRLARYSPGQLLMHNLLSRFSADPDWHHYDCMGPLSDAMSKWKPQTYCLGRLVMAPSSLFGRAMLRAYALWSARGRLLSGDSAPRRDP